MNREAMRAQRTYFDMVHGVTMKAVGALSDEDLDFRPREGMRSARELLYHIYSMDKSLPAAVQSGEYSESDAKKTEPEHELGAAEVRNIESVADMLRFAQQCRDAGNEALAEVTDADLDRVVKSPYGEFTGAQFLRFLYDEHIHHRGQLYTYIRLMGKEPPSIYDYG